MSLKWLCTVGAFCIALLADAGIAHAQKPIEIEFSQLRKKLPKDGEIIGPIKIGDHVWEDEKADFERRETLEISLGKGIRAKQKHRNEKDERSLGEGLVAKDGYIEVVAGWRAKKKAPLDDHFDGEVRARLYVEMNDGKLQARLSNVQVKWNRGGPIDDLKQLIGDVEGRLQGALIEEADKKLTPALQEAADKFFRDNPIYAPLKGNLSIRVVTDKLLIYIRSLQPVVEKPKPGVNYQIQSHATMWFLDVRGAEIRDNGDVCQAPSNPAQVWQLVASEKEGCFYIRSQLPAAPKNDAFRFLDVFGANKDVGGRICIAKQNPAQVWRLIPSEKAGYFYIQSAVSDLYLDVFSASTVIGERICQAKKHPAQVWGFVEVK